MIKEFKILRDISMKNVCEYFRNHNDSSTKEFKILWDKFMSISELIYIFEDYPYSYNVFFNYLNKKDMISYLEYEDIYNLYIDLLYKKISVYN
jgi:CRISPR/Cas system CMR-associated protein Cmr1 (group 7 of RAMP superfamily)